MLCSEVEYITQFEVGIEAIKKILGDGVVIKRDKHLMVGKD